MDEELYTYLSARARRALQTLGITLASDLQKENWRSLRERLTILPNTGERTIREIREHRSWLIMNAPREKRIEIPEAQNSPAEEEWATKYLEKTAHAETALCSLCGAWVQSSLRSGVARALGQHMIRDHIKARFSLSRWFLRLFVWVLDRIDLAEENTR